MPGPSIFRPNSVIKARREVNTTAPATQINATTLGAEVWTADNPPLRVTRLGAEVWYDIVPRAVVTQIGAEVWMTSAPLPTFRKPLAYVIS
jgi:hypothetical protein